MTCNVSINSWKKTPLCHSLYIYIEYYTSIIENTSKTVAVPFGRYRNDYVSFKNTFRDYILYLRVKTVRDNITGNEYFTVSSETRWYTHIIYIY